MPSSLDLQLFEAMPGNSALLLPNAPHFTIIAVTEGYVQTSEKPKAELVGKGLFEAFPNSPDDSTGGIVLRAILGKVLETKCPQNLPVHRYDIFTAAGAFDERYWSAVNKPVLNENGEILYIIHTAVDLTLQVRTEQNQKVFNELEKRYKEILAAPVLMCILKGDDYRVAMTNAQTLSVWGRSGDVVGKPIIEVLPELAGQEILDMLDMVKKRGELLKTYETSVTLLHNGTEDVRYFDFVFQPFYEPDNATVATGVVVVAHDQTKQVVAKKKAAESEEKFRSLIEHSPVAMHIVRGPDFVFEIINKKMLGLMGKTKEEVAGRRMMDVFPEIIYQDFGRMLQQSYATGERFEANEYPVVIMRDGAEVQLFLNFVYEPIREKDGLLPGIVVVAVDVTEQVTARRKVEVSVQEVHAIIDSAPFPIGVYTGKEMRIRFANQSIIDVWGKGPEVIGKTYAEVLPELEGSGIYGQLHAVYSTGVPYHARNQQVNLVVNGVLQPFFFNYSFTPLYDIGGKIYGVMNTAAEITDLHLAKLQVEQSERNFRSMIVQAP
ncbi:MAG: PAS domain S-box protein, partial [Chitinophagaceae bacterium]